MRTSNHRCHQYTHRRSGMDSERNRQCWLKAETKQHILDHRTFLNITTHKAKFEQKSIVERSYAVPWQFTPSKPSTHSHVWLLTPSTHAPLFKQGFGSQSSMLTKRRPTHNTCTIQTQCKLWYNTLGDKGQCLTTETQSSYSRSWCPCIQSGTCTCTRWHHRCSRHSDKAVVHTHQCFLKKII